MTDGTTVPQLGTPPAEVEIDERLVRALLTQQHPDLADLPLEALDAGWDNAMFRLGDEFVIRMPRRELAAPLISHEQRWLPYLAPHLTLPVPAPVRIGRPAGSYPWSWSVVPWLAGYPADESPLLPAAAESLAAFLRSLHRPAPDDAPRNPFRGVPLVLRAAAIEARMNRLANLTPFIDQRLQHIWQAAVATQIDIPDTWLHGDLHPRNILASEGRISGIIDWGDVAAGDHATDLAAFWMLFPHPQDRAIARAAYGTCSDATWRRAQGWAVLFGVVLLDSGLIDNPRNAIIGERTLRAVIESADT